VFPYIKDRADEPNPVPDVNGHVQYQPHTVQANAGPVDANGNYDMQINP
jgi:hypothetical protein